MKKLKKIIGKNFLIEYFTIYISIITVTIIVQTVLLKLDIILVLLCITKSIITTVPNVLAIMYGKKVNSIKKSRFKEALFFTLTSLPYLELSIVYVYEQNVNLSLTMIIYYLLSYFFIGLFNRPYLKIIKKAVTFSINTPKNVIKKIHEKQVKNAEWAFFFYLFSSIYTKTGWHR